MKNMKKVINVVLTTALLMALAVGFAGCGKAADKADKGDSDEAVSSEEQVEKEEAAKEDATKEDAASEDETPADEGTVARGEALSDEQAVSVVKNYCLKNNSELEGIINEGEYDVDWKVESSDDSKVVVLYKSYTGAEIRYYVDRNSGDTYVTEFVPGITSEEEKTGESFNAWEYLEE